MARSLLDTADLRALRDLAAAGPEAALAAVLVDGGVLQFDPDDPAWEDRDRLVVAGPSMASAVGERLSAAGADGNGHGSMVRERLGGDALGTAFGAAAASALDGGAWRSWCALDEAACDDGRVWEVARAAAGRGGQPLVALVAGDATTGLWQACGWATHVAPASDPAWLLSALDHALGRTPAVVLAVRDE